MATYHAHDNLGIRICEILGIDPGNVRSITLRCQASDADSIVVETLVLHDQLDALADAIKQTEFVSSNGTRLIIVNHQTQVLVRDEELSTTEKEYLWLRDKTEMEQSNEN